MPRATLATTALAVLVSLAVRVPGQSLSAEISPNPATPGQQLFVTVRALSPTTLACGGIVNGIRIGSPTGPYLFPPVRCRVGPVVGPAQPVSGMWAGPTNPGTYFAEIPAVNSLARTIPFTIESSTTTPRLDTTSAAQRGTAVGLSINAPLVPQAGYVVAAAGGTGAGFSIGPGQRIFLVQDGLFWLSLTAPNTSMFQGFVGVLDQTGSASASFRIPNLNVLLGAQLALQAAVIGPAGPLATNPLTRIVL